MKLLLTSAGLSNKSIIVALEKLLGKGCVDVKLAFIPTAANVEANSWLIDDLNNSRNAGFEVDNCKFHPMYLLSTALFEPCPEPQ